MTDAESTQLPVQQEMSQTASLGGIAETVTYLACNFLGDEHYARLHQALGAPKDDANATQKPTWDRFQSLSAAIKLMEEHGVSLTPEEVERLSRMDETQQITVLVTKMPQQSNEQFQRFFLQLQLLVSAATRVRKALEEGRPDLVEEAVNDADSTGISSYILRMAIVQAGAEVAALRNNFNDWVKQCDARMSMLIHGQDEYRTAQAKLDKANGDLALLMGKNNEKVKKVMMAFASASGTAFLHAALEGWYHYMKQMKKENAIRAEYEDLIADAQRKLLEYKAAHSKNGNSILSKKADQLAADLLLDAFALWKEVLEEKKFAAENADSIAAMEAKLLGAKASQVENTKRVMGRMAMGDQEQLLAQTFQGWVNFRLEYLKDKEMEDQVKAAEKKVQDFIKEKSEGARNVLASLSSGTDTGCIAAAMKSWIQLWDEAKKEAELAEILNGANAKFSSFQERNKTSGMSVAQRARYQQDLCLLLRGMNAWRLDARMESTLKRYQYQIDAKRQQLVGVQQMFRKFATQLESGLRDGQESSRDLRSPEEKRKRMQKGEGTVSLPDIKSGRSGQRTPSNRG